MASSGKTERLKLNLWEETDKPKREDFCADNLAVEAAVTEHADDEEKHFNEETRGKLNDAHEQALATDEKVDEHMADMSVHLSAEEKAKLGKNMQVVKYTGTNSVSRNVYLPFEPSFGIVFPAGLPPTFYGANGMYNSGTSATNNYFGFISSKGCSLGLTLTGAVLKVEQSLASKITNYSYMDYNISNVEYIVVLFS